MWKTTVSDVLAHEINNPVSFIYGNLQYTDDYIQQLLLLIKLSAIAMPIVKISASSFSTHKCDRTYRGNCA
ncbi:hypothetical protein LC653_06925 [Nostoc sp. CHAB 5784]|uniref:histidine kinase dimerization/phospho-acceptor domain-containing protein n=1 Tax=Nostoc mirabile TaxID=2907820 RepID=UPI001E3B62EE|nr:histidine kinase dimerization/phospho-acceptor domain-containing protein [Nostoc mirabile]MCC5663667.1 hypothetical protein [Nostoc mirabile CHAB5784]